MNSENVKAHAVEQVDRLVDDGFRVTEYSIAMPPVLDLATKDGWVSYSEAKQASVTIRLERN